MIEYNLLLSILSTYRPYKTNIMAKIVNPNAAGIDIASAIHYVAVPEDKCK